MTGWNYLNAAFSINNSNIITGCGYKTSGTIHAFALIPSTNTPTGEDAVVIPTPTDENGDPVPEAPSVSLEYDEVTGSGDTTVVVSDEGSPPPIRFRLGNLIPKR